MIRKIVSTLGFFVLLLGNSLAANISTLSETDRIVFTDRSDSNEGWVGCWNIADDLASMLDCALKNSKDPALRKISLDNVKVDILEYKTIPFESQPKTALFPGDAHRCLNVLKIKARMTVMCCCGSVVHEEVINSDHVLDFDHLQYDYCRYSNRSLSYPLTPLAHAHGDFIRDLYARIVRLHQRGML